MKIYIVKGVILELYALYYTHTIFSNKKKNCTRKKIKKKCVIRFYVSFMLQFFFFFKVRHVNFLSYQIWQFIELITQSLHLSMEVSSSIHHTIGLRGI